MPEEFISEAPVSLRSRKENEWYERWENNIKRLDVRAAALEDNPSDVSSTAPLQVLTADPASPIDTEQWIRSDLQQLRVRLGGTTYSAAFAAVASPIPNTSDALQQRIVSELSVFGNWCRDNGVQGYIGEFQTPNDAKRTHVTADQERWLELMRKWYATADHYGLWGTVWNGSVLNYAVDTTIWLNTYTPPQDGTGSKTLSKSYAQAPVAEANLTAGTTWRGTNIAGGEYEQEGFNNETPGTYDVDYRYADADSYSFLYGLGHRIVRLPFRWERLQPTLNGALNATEVGRLKTSLDGAQAAGMKVILDCHNYARYTTTTGTLVMGDGTLTDAHLNDFWTKMVGAFDDHAAVWAYDLMNEPNGLVGGAAQWETSSQAALDAIRTAGSSKLITVPGYNWSAARVWTTYHAAPWITDTNFVYQAHMYFDDGNNGTYNDTYDTTLSLAEGRGYVANPA